MRRRKKTVRERRDKEEKKIKSPSPDPSQACVWPYASQAECGKQTCSCTGGRRSSPRSSHGGTWCAPSAMSNACSPGHSRGRSTVGRRHLVFQVAGLHGRQREELGVGEERGEEEGEGKTGQKVSESMVANGWAAQSGMGVIFAICSTWESRCQAGIRCTTTSSRLLTHTRTQFCTVLHTAFSLCSVAASLTW